MSDTSFSGRALQGNLATVKAGGNLWWAAQIVGNPDDEWDYYSYGNIDSTNWATANFQAGHLIDIGNIDFSGDIHDSPIGKVGDVTVIIENLSGYYDTLRSTYGISFDGRVAKIYAGSGTQITDATSCVIMTGKIFEITPSRKTLSFRIRGIIQLQDKRVGEMLAGDVYEKYIGKIKPITHGDHSDDDAYLPLVIETLYKNVPVITLDTQSWVEYDSIWLWDDSANRAYRALKDSSKYSINSDLNQLNFWEDTTATLTIKCKTSHTYIKVDDYTKFTYYKSSGSDIPAMTLIKIDEEIMMIRIEPSGNTVYVDRAIYGTEISVHASGSTVYQLYAEPSGLKLPCQHVFYPIGISGMQNLNIGGASGLISKTSGKYWDLTALSDAITISGSAEVAQAPAEMIYIEMMFPEIGVDGDVEHEYIIAKASISSTLTVRASGSAEYWVSIMRDGHYPESPSGGAFLQNILRLFHDDIDTQADSFNNIDNGDDETDLHVDSWVFAVPSGTWYEGDVYSNNGSQFTCWTRSASSTNLNSNRTSGTNAPDSSGTLTKVSGSGSATLDYTSVSNQTLQTVSDISTVRQSLLVYMNIDSDVACTMETLIYRVGIRLDFNVDPIKYDFWARGKGRKNPGGYFNGDADSLLEEPTTIIEDIVRNDVDGMSASDLTESFFDEVYTIRNAQSWKLASTIYDKAPYWKQDVLTTLLEHGALLASERYDGTMALFVQDIPSSEDIERDITAAEIITSEGGVAAYEFGYTSTKNLVTRVDARYRPILAKDGEYRGLKYCERLGISESPNNFLTEGSDYSAKLQTAYSYINEDRAVTVELPHIRDEATAEAYAKNFILWNYRQQAILHLSCTYSVIDIEQWQRVTVDSANAILPTHLQGKLWLVQSVVITPNVAGKEGGIDIELIEFPEELDEAPPTDIDEGYGSIDNSAWDNIDEGEGEIDNSAWDEIIEV